MRPVGSWNVCGVRIELWPASPVPGTQEWRPPYLSVTHLVAPALRNPEEVLAVIDAFAAAGAALRDEFADYSPGVLL